MFFLNAGNKVHIQRFIHNLSELRPFLPKILKNSVMIHLNRWFPSLCSAVCQPNDLLCTQTKGLLKLGDIRKPGFISSVKELWPIMSKAIKNEAKEQVRGWIPSLFTPVCHQSDFLCKDTSGLLKLEDILPEFMMKGIEHCSENPLVTSAIVGGVSLICYGLYRRNSSSYSKDNPSQSKSYSKTVPPI